MPRALALRKPGSCPYSSYGRDVSPLRTSRHSFVDSGLANNLPLQRTRKHNFGQHESPGIGKPTKQEVEKSKITEVQIWKSLEIEKSKNTKVGNGKARTSESREVQKMKNRKMKMVKVKK